MIHTDECVSIIQIFDALYYPKIQYKREAGNESQNCLPLMDCQRHPFVPVQYRQFLV